MKRLIKKEGNYKVITQIVDGIKNYVLPMQDSEKLSEARLKVCNQCEHKTNTNTCGLCGCLLAFKSRTLKSDCPAGKWNDVDNQVLKELGLI